MYPPRRSPTPVLLLLALALLPGAATGQADTDGVRLGLTFGGTGLVGVSVEVFDDHRAVDVTVSTWSFKDVSVSVTGKELFGAADARPSLGLGLWLVVGWDRSRNPDATRNGVSLLARVPIGVDWRVGGNHFVTADIGVTRALWIRRSVPDDARPASSGLVPLPGFAYRWKS